MDHKNLILKLDEKFLNFSINFLLKLPVWKIILKADSVSVWPILLSTFLTVTKNNFIKRKYTESALKLLQIKKF